MDYSKSGGQGTASCRSSTGLLQSPQLLCSYALDTALARLRLGDTRLSTHLYRLRLSFDPYCPWCRNLGETIEHLMLQCPRSYSHRILLRSQLLAQNIVTLDLPTLLGAVGVHPSRQSAVIASPAPSSGRPLSYHACDHLAGHHQGE